MTVRVANVLAKVALVLLLVHAVLFPELPQYQGKAIGARLLAYPLSTVLVPVIWASPAACAAGATCTCSICASRRVSDRHRGQRGESTTRSPGGTTDALGHLVPWSMSFGIAMRYLPSGG
jgi:hypothetical protein